MPDSTPYTLSTPDGLILIYVQTYICFNTQKRREEEKLRAYIMETKCASVWSTTDKYRKGVGNVSRSRWLKPLFITYLPALS